jgi:energy-coupling factor transporter transmembrane protein EcfT
MHSHPLDNHSADDSPIHRLPAALKMAGAMALVIAVVSVPLTRVPFFVATAFVLLLVAAASLVPGAFLLKRLLMMEPLVLGLAVLTLLRPGGLIAVDNTLWGGDPADPKIKDETTEAIRAFNRRLFEDPRVHISLVPIGDGMTLALKLES